MYFLVDKNPHTEPSSRVPTGNDFCDENVLYDILNIYTFLIFFTFGTLY